MADLSKLRVVSTITILNKIAQTFKEEMGLTMTYCIEFDNPDEPIIIITVLVPEVDGKYCASIKVSTITNLLTKKNPNGVAEDLTTIFFSDMTNMILKEILK